MIRHAQAPAEDIAARLFTKEHSHELWRRILALVSAPQASLFLRTTVEATTNFARGDAHVATQQVTMHISLGVTDADGRSGGSVGSRLDDEGLRALVADAESAAAAQKLPEGGAPANRMPGPTDVPKGPDRFMLSALPALAPEARAEVFREATTVAAAAGLVSAGDLTVELESRATANTKGLFVYDRSTYAEFSLTARTKDGTGSGWAWGGYEDWSRVNTPDLIQRATDLARRSAKPVAVEPGRYTVILEPAAVAALLRQMTKEPRFTVWAAEAGMSVYSKTPTGTSKIGLQMMDQRVGVVSDPWDPEMPGRVIGDNAQLLTRVDWFKRGVLAALPMEAWSAQRKGVDPVNFSGTARLQADIPTQTLDEMIASTKRGIWVNRLWNVDPMDEMTLLLSGTTRDGTFLIENGKITKAIKNLRFTESPFFVFNKLEAASAPVRASRWLVAPRLKVRDFDFTSLTDAV